MYSLTTTELKDGCIFSWKFKFIISFITDPFFDIAHGRSNLQQIMQSNSIILNIYFLFFLLMSSIRHTSLRWENDYLGLWTNNNLKLMSNRFQTMKYETILFSIWRGRSYFVKVFLPSCSCLVFIIDMTRDTQPTVFFISVGACILYISILFYVSIK